MQQLIKDLVQTWCRGFKIKAQVADNVSVQVITEEHCSLNTTQKRYTVMVQIFSDSLLYCRLDRQTFRWTVAEMAPLSHHISSEKKPRKQYNSTEHQREVTVCLKDCKKTAVTDCDQVSNYKYKTYHSALNTKTTNAKHLHRLQSSASVSPSVLQEQQECFQLFHMKPKSERHESRNSAEWATCCQVLNI